MLCCSKRDVTERVAKSPAQSDSRPSRPLSEVSACPASPPCCAVLCQIHWLVREVATALALGYSGQRLARIETGEAFACKAPLRQAGRGPERTRQRKGGRHRGLPSGRRPPHLCEATG